MLDYTNKLQYYELTNDEINKVVDSHLKTEKVNDVVIRDCDHLACSAIATAAVKKYQEWLAKQCGEKPCLKCKFYDGGCVYLTDCGSLANYLGQQQGYAKGLQERGK